MAASPPPADPGWDEDPAWLNRDPMTAAEREAWLDRLCAQDDDPFDGPQEYRDPESCAPPPGQDELTAGELTGLGPVDPWLARDLASAAAANPKSTWCVTVTDDKGHAVGHGCARPEPRSHRTRADPGPPPGGGRVLLHPGQPGRAARRVRHLAATHPRTRAGLDRRDRVRDHRPMRAPARKPGPRPRDQAPAPVPGPARHLHQPHLPPPRRPVRLRAQHAVRSGRTDVPVQRRPAVQAITTQVVHPAPEVEPGHARPGQRRQVP
jgi:hypothetical protein